MKYNKKSYKKVVDEFTPANTIVKNCVLAFIFGGAICTIGEVMKNIFLAYQFPEDDAVVLESLVLVAVTGLLTGLGVFDNIAKVAGAGTMVPITGFANAVVAEALEFKREGFVLGTASKVFTLAGPVLLYGYCSSIIIGIITLILDKLGIVF